MARRDPSALPTASVSVSTWLSASSAARTASAAVERSWASHALRDFARAVSTNSSLSRACAALSATSARADSAYWPCSAVIADSESCTRDRASGRRASRRSRASGTWFSRSRRESNSFLCAARDAPTASLRWMISLSQARCSASVSGISSSSWCWSWNEARMCSLAWSMSWRNVATDFSP